MLGIEPAANVAKVAVEKGIPTTVRFFGRQTAERDRWPSSGQADLLLGNNVLAHVPDLNDFVGGMKMLLAPDGVITMEFPHLQRLMAEEPVRHDLPRALQLLLVRRRREGLRAPRPDAVRRRGTADARRLAADLRPPRGRTQRKPFRTERATLRQQRDRRPACSTLERYRGFGEQVQAGQAQAAASS